jgi:hypothetical protein
MDKPLHAIYKVSKLAYRIRVILIANKRVKKYIYSLVEFYRNFRGKYCLHFQSRIFNVQDDKQA